MIIETIKLGAVFSSFLLLTIGWRADVTNYEPQETETPLFDNDQFTGRYAVMAQQGKSLDIESTLRQWSERRKKPAAARSGADGELREWKLTFQTTPPLSVNSEGETGGSHCSVGETGGNESNECSVVNEDDPWGATTECSTAAAGEDDEGTDTCSVYVDPDPPEGLPPNNNTQCSARSPGSDRTPPPNPPIGQTSCSAGGEMVSESCSASGGHNTGGEADGHGTCSASAPEADTSCSAYGDGEVDCSTFGGEHLSCSAGYTNDPGDHASCSTQSEPTESGGTSPSGEGSFCSSTSGNNGPGGEDGQSSNICSAISHGNPPPPGGAPGGGGTADCSTLDNGGGTCSVQAQDDGMGGTTTSGQSCSAIGQNGGDAPDPPGGNPNGGFQCSTRPDLPPGDPGRPAEPTCSVVMPDGSVEVPETPAGESPRCGDPGAFPPPPE